MSKNKIGNIISLWYAGLSFRHLDKTHRLWDEGTRSAIMQSNFWGLGLIPAGSLYKSNTHIHVLYTHTHDWQMCVPTAKEKHIWWENVGTCMETLTHAYRHCLQMLTVTSHLWVELTLKLWSNSQTIYSLLFSRLIPYHTRKKWIMNFDFWSRYILL